MFRARDAFTVCVPLCICLRPICYRRRYGTLFDTPIYTKTKGNVGGAFGERKLNFALQLNGSEKRNTSCPCLLVTFCNYPSQRKSNVFDNKFNDSIFVFTSKTAWNNLFLNLIQRQTLCNKTFCRRKIIIFISLLEFGFGILLIVRGNGLGRLIFAVVCSVFRQV